ALIRRATRTPEPTTLTVDDVVLDLLSRRVTRAGQPIDLRPREFSLLEYLMRNTGKVVSKTMILSHVWDYNFDPQTNIVDVLVSRLREKIERPFVRVLDRGTESIVLSNPGPWDPSMLEIASIRLRDGTLVQVGKSTEAREDLLARFRAALGLVTLLIVLVALGGGLVATRTALAPIRALIAAVTRIIQTGRTDARVPLAGTGDALDDLTSLFNAMLDKIEGLVSAMR